MAGLLRGQGRRAQAAGKGSGTQRRQEEVSMTEFNPQKHYWGNPCKRGHDGMRYMSGDCVHCSVERANGWRKSNPGKRAQISKDYRKRNPDQCREQSRRWRNANPDKAHEKQRRYCNKHPERVKRKNRMSKARNRATDRERCMRRYATKKNATPVWANHDEIRYVYRLAEEKGLSVDHIVPISSGSVCGLHCADNLRCVPKALNQHKGNRYWPNMPVEEA